MKTKLITLAFGFLLLTSCTASRSTVTGWAYNDKSYESIDKRTVLYSAGITTEVKNCDTVIKRVAELAKNYNGYVLQSSNFSSTIKVPSKYLKEVMAQLEKIGKIKSKYISGNDVTDEFNDYSMRLENAEQARKRYLELLQKATTVEEMLKVEKELERLNGELEILKGKITLINHNVEYSSITVHYSQKRKLGILGYIFVGTYKCAKWLFVRN